MSAVCILGDVYLRFNVRYIYQQQQLNKEFIFYFLFVFMPSNGSKESIFHERFPDSYLTFSIFPSCLSVQSWRRILFPFSRFLPFMLSLVMQSVHFVPILPGLGICEPFSYAEEKNVKGEKTFLCDYHIFSFNNLLHLLLFTLFFNKIEKRKQCQMANL